MLRARLVASNPCKFRDRGKGRISLFSGELQSSDALLVYVSLLDGGVQPLDCYLYFGWQNYLGGGLLSSVCLGENFWKSFFLSLFVTRVKCMVGLRAK